MTWWERLKDAFTARFMPWSWIYKHIKLGQPTSPMAGQEGSDNALREVKKR